MSETIRVFLVDDHPIVRKGLQALIESQPDMVLVGAAADGVEAVNMEHTLSPDVTLLDIQMPRKNGVEVIKEIKETNPNARILVLTSFSEEETVLAAIKAGALGYLLKDSSPEDLLRAIRDVHHGRSSLHPDIAFKLLEELRKPATHQPLTDDPLTTREVDILQLVARGADRGVSGPGGVRGLRTRHVGRVRGMRPCARGLPTWTKHDFDRHDIRHLS